MFIKTFKIKFQVLEVILLVFYMRKLMKCGIRDKITVPATKFRRQDLMIDMVRDN